MRDELLQRSDDPRRVLVPTPRLERHLSNVDRSRRVDCNAVRCHELTWTLAGKPAADASYGVAIQREDAHAGADVRDILIDRYAGRELSDEQQRLLRVGVEGTRAVEVVDLIQVDTVLVEHLDTVVLPIGDVYPPVGSDGEVCGMLNWPGWVPGRPQLRMCRPSAENR